MLALHGGIGAYGGKEGGNDDRHKIRYKLIHNSIVHTPEEGYAIQPKDPVS